MVVLESRQAKLKLLLEGHPFELTSTRLPSRHCTVLHKLGIDKLTAVEVTKIFPVSKIFTIELLFALLSVCWIPRNRSEKLEKVT